MAQRQPLSALLSRTATRPNALKAYSSLELYRLPGVESLKNGGDPGDFEGTMAVHHLLQVWEMLTPDSARRRGGLLDPRRSRENHCGGFGGAGERFRFGAPGVVSQDGKR